MRVVKQIINQLSCYRQMEEEQDKQKGISSKASFALGLVTGLIIFGLVGFFMVYSLVKEEAGSSQTQQRPSFADTGEAVCLEDGKPIIRLFSTRTCPHCVWVKNTFDKVAREYVLSGKIVAYHWEVDTGDNVVFQNMTAGSISILIAEERMFKNYKFGVDPNEEVSISTESGVLGETLFAVFCREIDDFAQASSMPKIIVRPK